jgi:hypothetical protein
MVKSELIHEDIDGTMYWLAAPAKYAAVASPTAWLLPPLDEYTVAYKDRIAVLDPVDARRLNNLLSPVIIVDGRVMGTWNRTIRKGSVVIKTEPFTRFTAAENDAVAEAAGRYGEFLELPVEVG